MPDSTLLGCHYYSAEEKGRNRRDLRARLALEHLPWAKDGVHFTKPWENESGIFNDAGNSSRAARDASISFGVHQEMNTHSIMTFN